MPDFSNLPAHVGVIMDGNGRWAKRRGLPRKMGHKVGAETFRTIVRYANRIGLRYMTMYVFSTENWSRPKDEVNAIMDLLRKYLEDVDNYRSENIRIRFLGQHGAYPELGSQLRRAQRVDIGCQAIGFGRSCREDPSGGDHGADASGSSLYKRGAGCGSHHPSQRGIPAFQLSDLAKRLCGICLYGRDPLAGLQTGGSGSGAGRISVPESSLRRRLMQQTSSGAVVSRRLGRGRRPRAVTLSGGDTFS